MVRLPEVQGGEALQVHGGDLPQAGGRLQEGAAPVRVLQVGGHVRRIQSVSDGGDFLSACTT